MARPRAVTIDQLWRGPSSQPAWKRQPGQVADATNIRHDISRGAVVRNPSEFVADLVRSDMEDEDGGVIYSLAENLDPDDDWYFFSIRNIIVGIGVKNTTAQTRMVSAWDDDGTPLDVVLWDLPTSTDGTQYLDANLPSDTADIDVAVNVDTAIIADRTSTIQFSPSWSFRQCYNYIKNGYPGTTDELHETGWGQTDEAPDVYSYLFGNGENALSSADNDDLAKHDGHIVKIEFDQDLDPAGWYVYYDGVDSGTDGEPYPLRSVSDPDSVIFDPESDGIFPRHERWYRIPDGRGDSKSGNSVIEDTDNGQPNARIDGSTAPIRASYVESEGKVYITEGPWKQRLSGNQSTNPGLSLRQPKAVEFFLGRLFMAGGVSLSGSAVGEFWNFFDNNVNVIVDSDPPDEFITFKNVGKPLRLAVAGLSMILLCEQGQISYSSGGQPLSNVNGRMRLLTKFSTRDIRVGDTGNFVTFMDAYQNVYQLTYRDNDTGVQLTGHLNLADLKRFHGHESAAIYQIERVLYIPGADGKTQTHEVFLTTEQEIQSAWSAFTTIGDIVYVDQWQDRHRWVTVDDERYTLVKYVHHYVEPPADADFWPRLDRLERVDGVYNSATKRTTFTLSGTHDADETVRVVRVDENNAHSVLKPIAGSISGRSFEVYDNIETNSAGETPYVGFDYTSELDIGFLYGGPTATQMIMTDLFVFFEDTTNFEVIIVNNQGEERVIDWQGLQVGVSEIGAVSLRTGAAQFNVSGDARYNRVKLRHSGAGQAMWSALHYQIDPRTPSLR